MIKNFKNFMSKTLKRGEFLYQSLIFGLITNLVTFSITFADDPETPELFTATSKLMKAVSGWLTGIIVVSTGAVLGYHALQKALTDDQAVIAEKNRLMKNVLIGGAIAATASGLVRIVLGFYGAK